MDTTTPNFAASPFICCWSAQGCSPTPIIYPCPPQCGALTFSHPQTSTELPFDSRHLFLSHALLERGSCAPPPAGAPPASWAPGKHLTTVCVQTRWKEGGVQARGGEARGMACVMLELPKPTREERRRKVTVAAWKI